MPEHPQLLIVTVLLLLAVLILLYMLIRTRNKIRKAPGEEKDRNVEKKELFYQLIDLMPDWIYIKDEESRFVFANRHLAASHGIDDPREMKGKTDFDFYPAEVAGKFFRDEQEIIRSGKPLIHREERLGNSSGKETVLSTTKMPLTNRKGKVIGVAGIGRNITGQKQDQMRLKELSVVASATDNVVVIMDAEANFKWANQCFEERYKCSMEEFVARKGRNLAENSSNSQIREILEEVRSSKQTHTYTTRTQDAEAKDFWYQTHITPMLDDGGKIESLFLIDIDITSIKKADLQIKQQKYELEHQRDQLKKLNASKDRLFSIIAHDLKNPFQTIIGFAELLREDHRQMEEGQVEEYLSCIHQSSTSAYDLLFNLLEWARAQTRSVKIKTADLNAKKLCDEVLDLLCAQAHNKNIIQKNNIDPELLVRADDAMLHTVLRNLVGNAIKYTFEGGSIEIDARQVEDFVEISVRDSGLGMSEEKIKTLFSMDQKDSTPGTGGERGTGLGLLVCYEFLEMNQGSIGVESEEGKGSVFTITLPAVK